jgi:deoxycytidine triphosphate deaminase
VILSDRSIREELAAGRIKLEPSDDSLIQPASVDVRLDRYFRVFLNHTMPVIDVKKNLEELTRLVEIDDDRAFVLHPGEFVLGSTFERVALPDDLVARIEGKALALDTPVPTPTGWSTIGDLEPGDLVFHADGTPVPVVAATDVLEGRRCYEVRFSDGTVIVADAAHQWLTRDVDDRRCGRIGQIRTTEEVAATLTRSAREPMHRVDIAAPVQYPRQALPIDPYVVGARLVDGTAPPAVRTCADPPILDEIEVAGCSEAEGRPPLAHRLAGVGHTREPSPGRHRRNESSSRRLRALDLLGNEPIPDDYLRADAGQRQSLLEGLMDSDGYVDTRGRCGFTTTRRALAEQVRELAASLGHRPVVAEKRARGYGVDHGPRFDVTFTPDRPVFRLPRKLARQKRSGTSRARSIVSVTPTTSVPVRCIQVDDSTGLFLVSRSFIPTHNSSLGRLGLLIHSTAGFIDAGFDGHITLELSNVANLPITLYPGMKIGQISFLRMTTPADVPYGQGGLGSKYQGQRGPTPSRYWENFDPD